MIQFDYEEIEKEIFKCHNEIRANPSSYITKLKDIIPYFKDEIYYHPLEGAITTHEGVDAIEDAIQFLKSMNPVEELIYSEEISKACRDHIWDIGPKGLIDHIGSDGSNITDRIEKYCEWDEMVAENLDFGFEDGSNIIMNMIIDDGVKERCQRKNIFNKDFKYIGIGVGPHKTFGIGVVIGYANNIRKIGTEPEDVTQWINRFYKKERRDDDGERNNLSDDNFNFNNNYYEPYHFFNDYKFIDPDAPDSSILVNITKNIKTINEEKKIFTKKTFLLKNGIHHIIEIEG